MEKNLATFDPNLKNKIVELKAMYDDTKVKDSIQPKFDDFKKMHESQKKSIQSAIDTASCITLRDFDANDTRLTK